MPVSMDGCCFKSHPRDNCIPNEARKLRCLQQTTGIIPSFMAYSSFDSSNQTLYAVMVVLTTAAQVFSATVKWIREDKVGHFVRAHPLRNGQARYLSRGGGGGMLSSQKLLRSELSFHLAVSSLVDSLLSPQGYAVRRTRSMARDQMWYTPIAAAYISYVPHLSQRHLHRRVSSATHCNNLRLVGLQTASAPMTLKHHPRCQILRGTRLQANITSLPQPLAVACSFRSVPRAAVPAGYQLFLTCYTRTIGAYKLESS